MIAAGNFAISAVLMQHFAAIAATFMPNWEIIDYATDSKPDAPSGTARELVYRLSAVRSPLVRIPIEDTQGSKEAGVSPCMVPRFILSGCLDMSLEQKWYLARLANVCRFGTTLTAIRRPTSAES